MAHELSIKKNGKAEMAFVGETPWHGLGQSVTKGASIGVWAREAGMDWQAEEGTPRLGDEGSPHAVVFDDYKALYRSDTGAPLAIVGAGYNVVQPRDVLEFFRDLTEDGGWHIHTAGVLRGGRKLWAMASNGQRGTLGKSDVIVNNLLLATSLDGSMKTVVSDTAVRVVCANTLALALRDNNGVASISHRSVFDPAAVKRALGLAENTFEGFMRKARDLADAPVSNAEAVKLLAAIFQPKPPKVDLSWMGKIADLNKAPDGPDENRAMGAALARFDGLGMGSALATAKGTRWGLLNAVTEQIDHATGRTDDTRLDSAWFGRGNAIKQRALEVLGA